MCIRDSVSPTQDPAANWRRAMAGVLCALKCGRSRHGPLAKNAAMRAMLRSSAATSTISAGVGRSWMLDGLLILASARRHDPERPHFPIQVAALDTEHVRGSRHVPLL